MPDLEKPARGEVSEIGKAMRKLHADELDEEDLHDDFGRRLEDLVQKKLKSGEGVIEAPEETETSEVESADVIDLLQVLKERMQEPGAGGARKAPAGSGGLESRSKAELYERAKSLDIEGRSSMSKKELIEAIRGAG